MSMFSRQLGVTGERADRRDFELLQTTTGIATATSMDVFWSKWTDQYTEFVLHYRNVRQPNAAANIQGLLISHNGTAFATTGIVHYTVHGNASATIFVVAGTTGAGATASGHLSIDGGIAAGALATAATGYPGNLMVHVYSIGAGRQHFAFDWDYTNSASTPTRRSGHGVFATATALGLRLEMDTTAFSADGVDLWGVRRS